MRADLSGVDALLPVAEDVATDEVDDSHDEDDDARAHDHAPEGQPQLLLTVVLVVELRQEVNTKDEHCQR